MIYPAKYSLRSISIAIILLFILRIDLSGQGQCEIDTSFTDVIFLIDNSQSIDDLEFDAFEDIIIRSIQKVQDNCQRSQIGVVHYGGEHGLETFIEFDLSTENVFTAVDRRFCLTRNAQGLCSAGGGDDLNNAVGQIISDLENGTLSRNPINKLQLVIFTDAFGFEEECQFINCSVIRPFNNIDLLKTQFEAQITVVGASEQAEASLLAIYASPGGTYDNTDLFEDCANTVDGCELPRKYIPIEFNSPVEATSDNVLNCVGCEISIIQAINPELGANQSVCGDLGESAILTVTVPDAIGELMYQWSENLPNQATVTVVPSTTTNYKVTVTDEMGCSGIDSVTVFVETCVPDCTPDTSFTDVLFLVDNSQSIDDQEFEEFENLILASIQKVQQKCIRSQLGLIHYGGAMGAETSIEYALSTTNVFNDIERKFCTSRNAQGLCSSGGGDDLNSAIGDIIAAIENGDLNRNPINNLQLVIFTDAFGFEEECQFINCSVIRPFTNIDILKSQFDAQVTVVGASTQAEASLLGIYASPGGSYDNTDLFTDCSETFDGCSLPRKYIPVEFDSEIGITSDSIVSCVECEINIIGEINATIGEDQIVCSDIEDDEAVLTAVLEGGVAPFTYAWEGGFPDQSTIIVRPDVTTQYTVTITDSNGCEDIGTVTVIIEDCIPDCIDPPVFVSCPRTFTTCPGEDVDPDIIGRPEVEPASDGCPEPILNFEDVVSNPDSCNQIIIRTWTASYPGIEGLESTCEQEIQLVDNLAPELENLPENIVVDSDASCSAMVSWVEPTATDNCGSITITSSAPNGSIFEGGVTNVTYTAIDGCGNSSTAMFSITVIEQCCSEPPVIVCPPAYDDCPNADIDPEITGMPTATGGEDCPDIEFSYSDATSVDMDSCTITILRTWTAFYVGLAEDSALVASCVQTIRLVDTIAPIIINTPQDTIVSSNDACNAIITWEDPSAIDDCAELSLTSDIANGSAFDLGETVVTYTAIDGCGNTATTSFTVTVIQACCLDNPIINCPDDYVGCPGDDISIDELGEATGSAGGDFCMDPMISFSDETVSSGPCEGQIEIARTWVAVDPLNDELMASCIQRITLIDTIAPELLACPEDVTLEPNDPFHTWIEPIGIDECEVTMTSSVPNGSMFETGVTTVVLSAIDGCGNTTTCTFDVTVPEEVELTCPEDIVVACLDTLILEDLPTPVVTSACSECTTDNIEGFDYLGHRNGISYYISESNRSWTRASNLAIEAGGTLAVIQDQEENDYLESIMTVNAAYIGLTDRDNEGEFVWVDGTPLTYSNWYEGQPNDFGNRQDFVEFLANGFWNDQNNKSLPFIIEVECSTVTRELVSTEVDGSTTIYTVMYSAVDRCGTDDECTFTVTSDNSPQIVCPDDIVIEVPYGWSKVSWDTPTFQSCCSVCVPQKIKGFLYMGNLGDSYYYCSTAQVSWRSAEFRSQEIGGTLAVIETEEENDFISSRLIQRTAYIGLSDDEREGRFKWVDGTEPGYTSWETGAPTGDGDFVEMDDNGDWYDGTGLTRREFVVEIKGCNNVIQTEGPASGSTFRTGTTVVSYMAEDGCGGQAECSFTVTITDGTQDIIASLRSKEVEKSSSPQLRNIEIYPNPVTDRLFFNVEGSTDMIEDISIYRADGRRVGDYNIDNVISEGIDVSEFAVGIHLVNIIYQDGEVKSTSFVVQ